MILELFFVILLVFGICLFVYKGAINEFQILQKDYTPDMEWSELLGEQLPLVVRNLPRSWLGHWTQQKTEHKTWSVQVQDAQGRKFKTTWNNWIATPDAPEIINMDAIRAVSKLDATFQNWTLDGFRRWSWIPVSSPTPHVFQPGQYAGLQKLKAEYTAFVSTDGSPIELWIAHEGALPNMVGEELLGENPWTVTTKEIPWIDEAKFVEIVLRPGNAIVLPKHWYVAARVLDDDAQAWFWVGEFHTPISKLVSVLSPKN